MGHISYLIILCFSFAISTAIEEPKLPEKVRQYFKPVEDFMIKANSVADKHHLKDLTLECAICGIAVNEIEGFVAENISETEIEQELEANLCSLLTGYLATSCDNIVQEIPTVINMLEYTQSVSVICVELNYCAKPFTNYPDPQPVPTYVINMDLPPEQRWTEICSNETYQNISKYLIDTVSAILPGGGVGLDDIGKFLNDFYFPTEYAAEIKGCAAALGVSYGWVTLLNIGYEVSDACTSIVAQTPDGKILHARNLDFWDGMGFTDSLKMMAFQVEWQKGGVTQFTTTSFSGFVGVLSGMKPNAFSITIDTRFYPQGISEMFYEIIAAITEKNASLVTFLSRNVFQNENDFHAAVDNLSNDLLIADVYYIVAGVSAGEGAVISRNRYNATDVWMLDSPTRWYEVETNYDHWKQPPWFDDRVKPAENAMTAMGQQDLSLEGMFNVLSVKPVLNLQTTYTILACPADSSYTSFTRWCPYPCVE